MFTRSIPLFGWPRSFYLAAQGISLLYLLILGVYAWRMRGYDAALHAATAKTTVVGRAPAAISPPYDGYRDSQPPT